MKSGPPLALMLLALAAVGPAAAEIPTGVVIPDVRCAADPERGYALYLPRGYTGERNWPLVLAFDPVGRGEVPVELMREAAEEFGYIVAGSHDTRNFLPWTELFDGAAAMWRDVAGRFSVDERRVYTTGFSGGARLATEVALQTRAVRGVFVHGGGFRERDGAAGDVPFLVVAASGTGDMNHREMEQLHETLLSRGLPTRHLVFDGGHQWAPPETVRLAFVWFEIHARRAGESAASPVPVEALLEASRDYARGCEGRGDPYLALLEYEQLLRDFAGLVALDDVRAHAGALEADPEARRARKRHALLRDFEDGGRRRLVKAMRAAEANVADPSAQAAALRELRGELARIGRDEGSSDRGRADAARRLRTFVTTVGYERSVRAEADGDLGRAAVFLEIALCGAPESAPLRFRLAAARARLGDTGRALDELERAVELGFGDRGRLEGDEAFRALRGDERFRALLSRLADPVE